jgi:hypothetical protein
VLLWVILWRVSGLPEVMDCNVWHLLGAEKDMRAIFVKLPGHDINEAFQEFKGAVGGIEKLFPCLGLILHALGNHLFRVLGG